jgi:hypothetical protein
LILTDEIYRAEVARIRQIVIRETGRDIPRDPRVAQIQNVPLHHPPAVETLVLDDAPIEVGLAVLPSLDSSQEHDNAR